MGRKPKPVLYVIGPTNGYVDRNKSRFEKARKKLEAAGYRAVIPHDYIKTNVSEAMEIRLTLISLLPNAFGVALLDGQWFDKTAAIAQATAADCGIPYRQVDKWVEIAPRRMVI